MARRIERLVAVTSVLAVRLAVTALAAAPVPAGPDGTGSSAHDLPKVAIVDFEANPPGRMLPPPQFGNIIAEMMLDRLVSAGRFHVFDGQWLKHAPAPADARSPREIVVAGAREAGLDYLVIGVVTQFSMENRQRGGGAGGLARALPILGGFNRQTTRLSVSIFVRLVDVRSGEIVTTATGDGVSSRSRMSTGGLALVVPVAGGFTSGASLARDAQLDEATRSAVDAASVALLRTTPWPRQSVR